jgi:hypothetical protein
MRYAGEGRAVSGPGLPESRSWDARPYGEPRIHDAQESQMTFQPPPDENQPPDNPNPNQPTYNPYPQQPYPQQPYPYGPPQAAGTNGMAIAGFVLSFLCSILGLVFSIIGLNQAKERGQGGRGLAIAGIVISCLSIVIGIAIIAGSH